MGLKDDYIAIPGENFLRRERSLIF